MKQLTEKEAIEFGKSGVWKEWDDEQIVRLQLFQNLCCVGFTRYQNAMSKILDRPVYSHEFMASNRDSLMQEYLGTKPESTLDEIINLIPEEKRIIINK
jgi:hypothetical protein